MTDRLNRNTLVIFFAVFIISGFSGLIYESIWTHYLKLFLGHAAYAQASVLALFMGGMAVGSFICARATRRWKNLIMTYALVEAVIGVFALLFHTVFTHAIEYSYVTVIPAIGSPATVQLYKMLLSAALILPQTILLGMTFPLMTGGILRGYRTNPGRVISLLYFTNSIGAAVGVLVSGFFLISAVGLPGTIGIAGLINIALACIVFVLARESGSLPEPMTERGQDGTVVPDRTYYLLLFISLGTGAASFIYEIAWIRMLSLVLGTSTHAFELMLSAFILGLAFGGLWMQKRIDTLRSPVQTLVIVQICMGVLALLTLFFYGYTFDIMSALIKALPKTESGYRVFNVTSHFIAMVIMIPATFCAGMTLPLITFTLIRKGYGERSIGDVYGANTIGSIAGVAFAIMIGMPALGLKGLLTLGGCLDIALGLLLLWMHGEEAASQRMRLVLSAGSIAVIPVIFLISPLDTYKMSSGVYRHGIMLTPEANEVRYYKDGRTASASIIYDKEGVLSIRTNGKPDAAISTDSKVPPIGDEYTMTLAALIPMAINPDAKVVANIGIGSGMTVHSFLQNPKLTAVDTVEIEEKMIDAAKYFGDRVQAAFRDPRSRFFIDDAKTFFTSRNTKYDIIISEPSNPWVSGVASLYSHEFYRMVSRYLTDDGLFVQWLQLYEIDLNLVSSVMKSLSANFSDYKVYLPNTTDMLIVSKKNGTVPSPDPSVLFDNPQTAALLAHLKIGSLQDITVRTIGNKKTLQGLFESFPAESNSDYYPVLDQGAARTRFLDAVAVGPIEISTFPLPVLEMLRAYPPPEGRTHVTPNPSFPKSYAVFTAATLRDYLLEGRPSEQFAALPDQIKEGAKKMREVFSGCSRDPERKKFIFQTSMFTFPYLNPSESELVWKSLESGRCQTAFSETERQYISLFKAIGRRDGNAMTELSKRLLETDAVLTHDTRKYLVASAMLGSLSQGKRDDALAVWERYKKDIMKEKGQIFIFRFLSTTSGNT